MISDINSFFDSTYIKYKSDFYKCSKDKHNNKTCVYCVTNTTDCFDFDEIKNSFDRNLKSVDSLFFSNKISSICFIEFKNKDMMKDHSYEGIGKKGSDSLFIFTTICANNSLNYNDDQALYVCVFSYDKTSSDYDYRYFINAIIKAKVQEEDDFLQYNNKVKSRVECKMRENYPTLNYLYSKYKILLSNNFDNFVTSIK